MAANPVIAEILRQGQGKPRRWVLAALTTGRVESNFRNLPGGDRDSQGWRQERASLYRNPRNLKASVRRFYEEAAQHDHGQGVGELAADIQRPAEQYRGRYAQALPEARKILARGGIVTGGGSPGKSSALKFSPVALAQQLGLSEQTADETQRPTVSAPPAPTFAQGGTGIYRPIETTGAPQPRARLDIAQRVQALTGIAPGIPGATSGGGGSSTPGRTGGGATVKGELYELIWRGPGSQTVKNGSRVGRDFYSKHEDHVHVAARQKDLIQLGRMAQRMGLHVSENPAFDPVDPVHVQGSFHYGRSEKPGEHDRAIDVSGNTAAMRKFARRVARLYRV